jgi:Cu2+-exporting ATPase
VSCGAEMIFFISGMWCGTCSKSVASAVRGLPGVEVAEVSFSTRLLTVRALVGADPAELEPEILSRVQGLGFGIKRQSEGWLVTFQEDLRREHARAVSALRLALVGFFAMWSSMFAFAHYLGGLNPTEQWLLTRLSAGFGLPAILLGVPPFLHAGWRALAKSRLLTLDLFIGLGGLCALGASLLSLLSGGADSYLDSAGMVLFVLLLAKALEAQLSGYLSAQILSLHRQGADSVEWLSGDGTWKPLRLERARQGQQVRFQPGQTISLDGQLDSPRALINAHLISGEAGDLQLLQGAPVLAGSIARSPLQMTVREPLGQRVIDRWAESSLLSRGRPHAYSSLLRQLESGLAGAALLAAGVLGLTSWSAGEAFFVGVLIFCPCLFASILPLSKQLAHLALGRLGVRLYRPEALLDLGQVETVYLDKTGTLEAVESYYEPSDATSEPRVRALLSALASRSGHPVLSGLQLPPAQFDSCAMQLDEVPGQGVQARLEHDTLLVGRPSFVAERLGGSLSRIQGTYPLVALNGRAVGRLITCQQFDALSLEFLRRLLTSHRQVHILSGDPQGELVAARYHAVDSRLSYEGNLTPADKAQRIGERGGKSLFVGDGLNDTPAMACATVSCRVGRRAPTVAPVDLEIPSGDLSVLLTVLNYSQRFLRTLKQTALLAASYNVLALLLACQGHFTPLGAVLAMFTSLTLLTLSAARLLRTDHLTLSPA